MLTRDAETETMDAEDARADWADVLDRVRRGETRVLVATDGVPVAAIVSADDLERLARWEAPRREALKALQATWNAFRDVPDEEIEREVTRALADVRAANRRRQQAATVTEE